MAFNIPQPGGFDEASIKGALEKKVMENFGVDSSLEEWATVRDENDAQDVEDKDDFEAKLMQIRPNDWKDFVLADGKINIEYLKDKLTGKEKLSMLASHIIGDQLFSIFFPGKKDGVKTVSFAEAAEFFEKDPDKKVRKVSGGNQEHLVWDQSMFGQIQNLFSLADLVTDQSEEGKEAFPLVPGTFWFVNFSAPQGGPKLRPTMYSALRKACERVGVKLTFLTPGEPTGEPAKDEIKLSFLPPSSIPLDKAGEVDYVLLDWYVDCYKKAPWMLMQGNPLLAAIHMRMRGPTEDVTTVLGVALDDKHSNLGTTMGQGFSDSLKAIDSKEASAAAPVEAPKVHLLPMQGDKVDKAKLMEYKEKLEKENVTWLTPAQKAGVFVLQGSPVEQAIQTAGIPATDPNYATLKTDLESLNQ